MARLIRLVIVVLVLAAAAVAVYAFFLGRRSGDDGLKLVAVTEGSITEKALATGQIEPRVKFHVKSKISGIVRRCFIQVGDVVRPGDPLFEIVPDPTPVELIEGERRVEQALTAFTRAQADHQRIAGPVRAGSRLPWRSGRRAGGQRSDEDRTGPGPG